MSRRFSPSLLFFALVSITLWGAVLFDNEAREVWRQHVHNALVPYSRNYSYESLDDNRVEDRIVRADHRDKTVRPLLDSFPADATLLATYLRGNSALFCRRRLGPRFSPYTAWSVQIRGGMEGLRLPIGSTPPASTIEEDVSERPPANETADVLRLIERGKQLEPQNSFWDWMEMAALLATGRENELPRIVTRANSKQEWNDHITETMRASTLRSRRNSSLFGPAAQVQSYSATIFPHLSIFRNVTNALAQQVMGLRLQGRDAEALQLGIQTMRLARMVRLHADMPITSMVATACERIALREARVPLGQRARSSFPLPSSALANDPGSLLFLAQRISPSAAREISDEWTRLNGWKLNSLPDSFGGLVAPTSLEQVAWTTRAAIYGFLALPASLVMWLILSLVSWRWNVSVAHPSRWGSAAGVLLLVGFGTFDWITRALALRSNPAPGSFCMTGYTAPEEVLFPFNSLLYAHGLILSGVTVWLGMFAFCTAFAPYRTPRKKPENVERTQNFHPIDILWTGVRWLWRGHGKLWAFLAPPWILALALTPAVGLGSSDSSLRLMWVVVGVTLSLLVWPVAVGVRQIAIFLRTRQRTSAPARFVSHWRSALSSFLFVMLTVVPILFWAQSRFEREFARQFAPIERGQMVAAIQKMRGIPMQ